MNIVVLIVLLVLLAIIISASLLGSKDKTQDSSDIEILSDGFTVVILPDTQKYSKAYPHIFTEQTKWIKDNIENRNIAFVLHEGDITNDNTVEQWQRAKKSMNVLDGEVPYVFAPGNHDIGQRGRSDTRDTSFMNEYFPYSKYSTAETFGGAFEEGKMDNTYHFFNTGEIEWLVLALEFAPRDDVLEWANEVVAEHSNKPVMLVTHTYLYSDSTLHGSRPDHKWTVDDYGIGGLSEGVNSGVDIWNKLVRRHKNFVFVFNGHVLNDGTGRLVSRGDNGNLVYQMLANYQMNKNGGNGFLRTMEIHPENGRVIVRTYSPYLDKYKVDSENEFIFEKVNLFP